MANTGNKPVKSENNLLTTIAWKIGEETTYALEGSIFIGGAVVQWLRDGLDFFKHSSEVEVLARSVEDNGGVYLVPAFTGLGAPHWDQYARGVIVGITRGTTRGHIARAALESITYQTRDVVGAMIADGGGQLKELRVDGGASANDFLMQFQADIMGINVVRPGVLETTALGAAYLAGLAVGFWENLEELKAQWQQDKKFTSSLPSEEINHNYGQWKRAVDRAKNWLID